MLRAEFTVEPFVAGNRGPYGEAALETVRASGLVVDDGPFGTAVTGDDSDVIRTVATALERAMAKGATRVSVQVTRHEDDDEDDRG